MKETFTSNTSELNAPEHQGPIVFNMDQPTEIPAAVAEPQQLETLVEAPVETPTEVPAEAPISTEIQPEVGAVPPVEAEAPKESPAEEQVVDLDQDAPKAETAPAQPNAAFEAHAQEVAASLRMTSSETTTRTVESGPVLAKGYERIGKFGERVKGWKGKLLRLGGMLLRGAGRILKGTLKLAKAGFAALVSPDVLMKRGAKSVAEFGAGVKKLAVDRTTESCIYARDSFLEAWGGLKAKGDNAVEGAKNKVTDLWKGMVAMKTEILLKSLEKKRQQAATQEAAARTTREALEAQMAEKMKLLDSLHAVTPRKAEANQELPLAA